MIRRFFCLLLVLLIVANPSFCLAHSHHGTDIADSQDHASRAHFHLGGHCHLGGHGHCENHSHRHDSDCDPEADNHNDGSEPLIGPMADHDADAVYVCSAEIVTTARGGRIVSNHSTICFAARVNLQIAHRNGNGLLRLGPLHGQPESVFETACPIYLRVLSLRI